MRRFVGILLRNLLNMELKSFIFSPVLAFGFDRSLMSDAVVLSSQNLTKNCYSNIFHLVIERAGNEKYQDPANLVRVYGNSMTTQSSSITSSKLMANI